MGLLGPDGAAGTGVGRAGVGGEWGVFLSAHLGVMSTLHIMGLSILGEAEEGDFVRVLGWEMWPCLSAGKVSVHRVNHLILGNSSN